MAAAVRDLDGEPDLIVAPELCVTGYDLDHLGGHGHQLAETLQGPTVALVAELAAERRATVVVGLLEADDGRLYDSAVVAGPDGVLASYRKSHLYPPETAVFAAGDRLLTTPSTAGHLGLMICFEHAFPEIATTLALDGAQVLVIPSAVPVGYEHLLALRTRARAQDNQVFAVASNLTGDGFCGGSMIVDPRGEVSPPPSRGGRHRGHHRPGGDPARAATRAGAAPAPGRALPGRARRQDGLAPGVTGRDQGSCRRGTR